MQTNKMTKKKSGMQSKRTKELIFYWALIAYPVINYIVFYICVNFNSILLAFKEYKVLDGVPYMEWGGFVQFERIFTEIASGVVMKQMLGNSLTFYFFGLLVTTPIALVFSYYIYKKYVGSEFFRVMLFLPSIISSVVTVFMFKYMLDTGLVTIAEMFNVEMMPITGEAKNRMTVVLLYTFLMGFGTNVLMYSSAMASIPESVAEYASLDGASAAREFFSITLPLIFNTLSTFIVVGIAGIFTNQANLYALYGNVADTYMEVKTLGFHLFMLTNLGITEKNFPEAAALGLLFTLVAFPLTMVVRKVLDKINPNA